MKDFKKRYQNAQNFVNFNLKEGFFNEEDWVNLPPEEFVKQAEYEQDRADAHAEAILDYE